MWDLQNPTLAAGSKPRGSNNNSSNARTKKVLPPKPRGSSNTSGMRMNGNPSIMRENSFIERVDAHAQATRTEDNLESDEQVDAAETEEGRSSVAIIEDGGSEKKERRGSTKPKKRRPSVVLLNSISR
jgi:hypothetical protein